MAAARTVGDLAIVLHSPHALRRGVRDLPVRRGVAVRRVRSAPTCRCWTSPRDLTMTVTPVLADQLEDAGVARAAARASCVDVRGSTPRTADLAEVAGASAGAACEAERDRLQPARWSCSTRLGGDPLRAFQEAAAEGRIALIPSAATHAVLPLLATAPGLRLQLDAGHPLAPRAASAGTAASGCPSAPTSRASSGALAERGVALVLPRPERARATPLDGAARRSPTAAGPVALPIDWEAISLVWSLDGYPSDPRLRPSTTGTRCAGCGSGRSAAAPYDPAAAAARGAPSTPRDFLAAVARPPRALPRRARPPRPARLRDRHRAARPLVGGGAALAAGGDRGRRGGRRPPAHRCRRRSREHEPEERPAARLELGRGEGPRDLGLARRSPTSPGPPGAASCACCGRSRGGLRGERRGRARRARAARRCSRATGPSSTSAGRPATTPTQRAHRPRARRCWRP